MSLLCLIPVRSKQGVLIETQDLLLYLFLSLRYLFEHGGTNADNKVYVKKILLSCDRTEFQDNFRLGLHFIEANMDTKLYGVEETRDRERR